MLFTSETLWFQKIVITPSTEGIGMSWQWKQEERGVCKTEKLIDGWMALTKNPFCGGGMLLIRI